jgi:hypothetical protein
MIALAPQRPARRPALHTKFLAMLPVITRYASLAFRSLDAEARDDAMAEVVANAYVAFARLAELGKTELAFPTVLALYSIRQYWDARRVGTKANSNDLYAQQASLPREYLGTPQDQGWKEPLIDNRKSPVPDQAAFRIDFPQWLETLPQRDRDIVLQLCQGDRPVEVARHHGITRGRGSQLRKELHDGWLRFHGEISSSSRD